MAVEASNSAVAEWSGDRIAPMSSWASRLLPSRLFHDHDQSEAADLVDRVEDVGAEPIGGCTRGTRVRVCGTIRSLAIRPQAESPALVAEVFDGSGHVSLVWMGRRRIPGIEVGRSIIAEGRITCPDADLVIYNPVYTLQPRPQA